MMTKPLFVNVGYEHPVEFPIHLVISTDDFSVVHCTKRRSCHSTLTRVYPYLCY
ncbi:hypothetical protein LINPERPRIM_LOCUS25404 [Linum perenne]